MSYSYLNNIVAQNLIFESTNNSVAAAGTTQGTATLLEHQYNVITSVPISSGVRLPAPDADFPSQVGVRIMITNNGANPLLIYPPPSSFINTLAVNAAFSLPPNVSIIMESSSTTQWFSFGGSILPPSLLPGTAISDTIIADQNDYNPTGLSTSVQILVTPSGATRTITGLQIYGTMAAPVLSDMKVTNVDGTNNLILAEQSASSMAANRFVFDGQDVVLLPGQSCTLFYDFVVSRWRGTSSSQDGRLGGAFVTGGVLTPATISVDQNDYNPTGISNASVLRLSATTAISMTGITGGVNGRQLILLNISTNPIVLQNESLLSMAANRFDLGSGNLTLIGSSVVIVIYDAIIGRWKALGGTGGTAAGGLIQSQWVEVTTNSSTTATTWTTPNTTVNAAGSLPSATITTVAQGTNTFPPSGIIYVNTGTQSRQTVTYTGKTLTSFTGCTGGTGTLVVGGYIWGAPATAFITDPSNGLSLPQTEIYTDTTARFPTSGTLLVSTTTSTESVAYTGLRTPSTTGDPTGPSFVNVLPIATLRVASTAGFPTAGTLLVQTTAGLQTVTYTGTTAITFTGCAGGTGSMQVTSGVQLITTIAVASDGAALPQATINVASTAAFPTSGKIVVTTGAGDQTVTYTGVTATTFTGCTGGTGTMSTGGRVTSIGFTGCTGGSGSIATGGKIIDISATPDDLLTIPLTTNGGAMILNSTITANATNNQTVFFQLLIDGVVLRGSGASGNGGAPGGSAVIGVKLTDVPAGAHFVVIRWRVSGGTSSINVITTGAEINNGSLLVQEVSS